MFISTFITSMPYGAPAVAAVTVAVRCLSARLKCHKRLNCYTHLMRLFSSKFTKTRFGWGSVPGDPDGRASDVPPDRVISWRGGMPRCIFLPVDAQISILGFLAPRLTVPPVLFLQFKHWVHTVRVNAAAASLHQSINQSKHICIAPYVANESEALHNGRD